MTEDFVFMWFVRIEAVLAVLWAVFGIRQSRRVLVAWTTFVAMRWQFRKAPQSHRRWLWVTTLRYADGKDVGIEARP